MKKKTLVELKLKDTISYKDIHPSYGRAEFEFCPVYKKGKLVEIWITPAQQETNKRYRIKMTYQPYSWQFTSWTHKGIENPRIWLQYWCKEHKALCMRVYVPPKTSKIRIESGSTLSFIFE